LVILVAAALIHWHRTRHWCLLALATGSLLVALSATAMQIVVSFHMRTLTFGAVVVFDPILVLACIWWLRAFGEVVAGVGGIGAIHWAIKLRRRT
jgi:hypothetical protein